jgi:integrase
MKSLADKLLPERLKNEIERFLQSRIQFRSDPQSGVVSVATQEARRQVIAMAYAQLWEMGYRLSSAKSLGERHVRLLAERWEAEGLAAGTLRTRLSYLSTFCGWIGKPGMVKSPEEYCSAGRLARSSITTVNKSWEAKGKNPIEVIAAAMEVDPRLALYLTLQHEFGFRMKESLEFRPRACISADGKSIAIVEGTKGGRPRIVPIERQSQQEALDWALEVAKTSRSGRVRWPHLTFRQAQARFYGLLRRKLGISKKECGLTAHGLRHGYAQTSYTGQTGLPSPVEGGALGQIDRETHERACLYVSRALGHVRPGIAGAYYGSYGHQLRTTKLSIKPPTIGRIPLSKYV